MRFRFARRLWFPLRQPGFEFMERSRRRDRWFKRLIFLTTCLAIVLIFRVIPWGRYLAASITASMRQAARQGVGLAKTRSEIDDSWQRFRQFGIETTQQRIDRVYADSSPPDQRLLRYAGMDPEHALLRWGNYDWTMLLSSAVFEADDEGRSYRLRPRTRSIWLWNGQTMHVLRNGARMFFLVPDGPGLADAVRGTKARLLESSRQTTNSWGLRGPEPDLVASLRGIVLGDSFMQGAIIGDDETPPECLRRYLQDNLKTRVSILNTGVLGYSPEQYYHSLIAFGDRFRPQFVVVSVFANDFGDLGDVATRGIGDWREAKYWLEKIIKYCRARRWPYLIVPAPYEQSLLARRNSGYYPGTLANTLDVESLMYLDPLDDFVDAFLELQIEGKRQGRRISGCPLFNDAVYDTHFSAAGSEVWAASVGRRLRLILERDRDLPERAASSREINN